LHCLQRLEIFMLVDVSVDVCLEHLVFAHGLVHDLALVYQAFVVLGQLRDLRLVLSDLFVQLSNVVLLLLLLCHRLLDLLLLCLQLLGLQVDHFSSL
jgi:hypothetical protein